MRPRHKAAENCRRRRSPASAFWASMRPRHKAAENCDPDDMHEIRAYGASMRPRHKAAENVSGRANVELNARSFNEAAA